MRSESVRPVGLHVLHALTCIASIDVTNDAGLHFRPPEYVSKEYLCRFEVPMPDLVMQFSDDSCTFLKGTTTIGLRDEHREDGLATT